MFFNKIFLLACFLAFAAAHPAVPSAYSNLQSIKLSNPIIKTMDKEVGYLCGVYFQAASGVNWFFWIDPNKDWTAVSDLDCGVQNSLDPCDDQYKYGFQSISSIGNHCPLACRIQPDNGDLYWTSNSIALRALYKTDIQPMPIAAICCGNACSNEP